MKKLLFSLLLSQLMITPSVYSKRIITDTAGNKVALPDRIERIADAWPAHNAIVTMLGSGKKVVATIVSERMCPWLYKINPAMNNAAVAFASQGSSGSIEELAKANPDIIFVPTNGRNIEKIKSLKYTVFELQLSDFQSLKKVCNTYSPSLGRSSGNKQGTCLWSLCG